MVELALGVILSVLVVCALALAWRSFLRDMRDPGKRAQLRAAKRRSSYAGGSGTWTGFFGGDGGGFGSGGGDGGSGGGDSGGGGGGGDGGGSC